MQSRISSLIMVSVLAVAVTGLVAGCASNKEAKAKEEHVSLPQLSQPARTTVERETAGGRVESIVREIEKGQVVYDVEATVGGKHAEFLIADADGAVLGTETQIEYNALPEPVRAATEKFFGTTTGLTVMKGVEYGETSYEIEGPKSGKTVEVTFDPTGKRTE